MIDKHELRIGNTVYATVAGNASDKPVEYTIQSGADIDNAHWYFPIPLTPEILERLGFKVREASSCREYYIGTNEFTKDWLFNITWLDRPELINSPDAPFYRNRGHTIYFVHQLQNLYFDLTGTELTLKP